MLLFHPRQQRLPGVPPYPRTEAPLLCALLSTIAEGSQSCHHWHGCADALCFAGIGRSGRRLVFLTPGAAADLSAGFAPWTWLRELPGRGKRESGSPGCQSSAYPAGLLELSFGASYFSHRGTATSLLHCTAATLCPELLCPSNAQGRYLFRKYLSSN